MRAGNRSEHTIASYLESPRQAEAYLAGRGRNLVMLDTGARRVELADVQLGDLDMDVGLLLGRGRRERALRHLT